MATIGPAPINRLPLGLLSFFDIKQFGKSPMHLGEVLAPQIDLTEFYLASSLSTRQGSQGATAGATGFLLTETVPNGESWLLVNFGVRANGVTTGDSIAFAPSAAHRDATGAFVLPDVLGPEIERDGNATNAGFFAVMDPKNRGRVLPPGTGLGTHIGRQTSAAIVTYVTTIVFARLLS